MIHATITGRLGRDPEIRTLDRGTSMLRFSIASDHGYGDRKATTWVSCTLFGKRAETMSRLLTKGSYVIVRGAVYATQSDDGKTWVNCDVDEVDLPPRAVNAGSSGGTDTTPYAGVGTTTQAGGDHDIPF